MRKMPFAAFAHNQAWLEVSLLRPGAAALGGSALPGRRARPGRAQAGAPAPAARRRAPGALGPASGAAAAALLAVGRGAGGGVRAAAGAAGGFGPIATSPLAGKGVLKPLPRRPRWSRHARERDRRVASGARLVPGRRQGGFAGPPRCRYLPQVRQSHSAGVKTVDRG